MGGPMKVTSLHHVAIRVQHPIARVFYENVLGLSFVEIPVGGDFTKTWKCSPSEGSLLPTQAGDTFAFSSFTPIPAKWMPSKCSLE